MRNLRRAVIVGVLVASIALAPPALAQAAPTAPTAPAAPAAPAAAAALITCYPGIWFNGQEDPIFRPLRYFPFGEDLRIDCVMGQGNQSPAVKALQNALIKCYGQAITRDGAFGARTREALRMAQIWESSVNHKNVVVDGVFGPQTRDAMMWPMYAVENLDAPFTCRYHRIG